MNIGVIVPAYNEQENIKSCVSRCRDIHFDTEQCSIRIVVCDNNSDDLTSVFARAAGAEVAHEPVRGYGAACIRGIAHLGVWPDIILFCDADSSPTLQEFQAILFPVVSGTAQLSLGARTTVEPGAMSIAQVLGNKVAVFLIRMIWGRKFIDLGPLRAIEAKSLERLRMSDFSWGWTIEMQIQAIYYNLKIVEVPIVWRRRQYGYSKISGTVSGVIRAGTKILYTVIRLALKRQR